MWERGIVDSGAIFPFTLNLTVDSLLDLFILILIFFFRLLFFYDLIILWPN
jgi:hypothetical protein